jgi:O-antigen ligase
LVGIVLLLVLGVMQTLNPKYLYDPVTHGMTPLPTYRLGLPGTMDQQTSLMAIIHWGALALAFLTLTDLLRHRDLRWFLQTAMAITAVGLAVFGIAQKIQGAVIVPFTSKQSSTFFGTYVYHAHAAAFLNLCWPSALALAIRALYGDRPFSRAIWINGFLLIFVALFINISKFGHLAALPGLALAFLMMRKGIPSGAAKASPIIWAVIAVVVLGAMTALALPLVGRSIGRWDEVMRSGFGGRPLLFEIALNMIRQYPLWGTGPGSFHLVFPYFSAEYRLEGRFTHAHQDYLQTLVEWGIPGGLVWFGLVGGGFLKGCREHWRRPEELSTGAALLALTILGVHAMVDFPLQIGSLRLYAAVYLAMLWRDRADSLISRADGREKGRA